MNSSFSKFIPSAVWAAIITLLSLTPGGQLPSIQIPEFDKYAHIFMYAMLLFLLLRAFMAAHPLRELKLWQVSCFICAAALYGALLEAIQGMVFVNRFMEFTDIITNTIGCFCGLSLFLLFDKE